MNIDLNKTYLGIEFGSTRIKAVLSDENSCVVASGSYTWENRLENGVWTYSLDDIKNGLQDCFSNLAKDFTERYEMPLTTCGAMGISAMMHGLMAFDENDKLLTPFRTWRNTMTAQAASELTGKLSFNIPERWTCAHLYQAVISGEEFVSSISHVTTLAGYVHYLLSGKRIVGIGEASGIFPVLNDDYDKEKLAIFSRLLNEKGFTKDITSVLPKVRLAGENAGSLTSEGALLLDPTGSFRPGVPLCPPEGDAGTGMVAADAVKVGTGNVSGGTSIFSMLVLEKPLKGVYPEIDMVTTPSGEPVAMVHCNNCCNELDGWVNVFAEFCSIMGVSTDKGEIYEKLYRNALNCGDCDCGGIVNYNFLSGEPVAGVANGRPMYFKLPKSKLNLANFMRSNLYAAFSALKMGMDILTYEENIKGKSFTAHGGLFKVQGVAQQILADALDTPVSVMETAGEGGAWGMSLLASYMINNNGLSLSDWMEECVFSKMKKSTLAPDNKGKEGFDEYMKLFKAGLLAQKKLGEVN